MMMMLKMIMIMTMMKTAVLIRLEPYVIGQHVDCKSLPSFQRCLLSQSSGSQKPLCGIVNTLKM